MLKDTAISHPLITGSIESHQMPSASLRLSLPPPLLFFLPLTEGQQVGSGGQLERWLADHHDWWMNKCLKCRQVAKPFLRHPGWRNRAEEEQPRNRKSLARSLRGHTRGKVKHRLGGKPLPAWLICNIESVITFCVCVKRWRWSIRSRVHCKGQADNRVYGKCLQNTELHKKETKSRWSGTCPAHRQWCVLSHSFVLASILCCWPKTTTTNKDNFIFKNLLT